MIGEDVGDDPHRRTGRIDVGVAHHELFEDVVLDRAGQLLRADALLFGGHDVERHDGQDGAVHGHRHAHRVERDAVEQRPHVEDRVDRDAGHADIARDARVVAVVAAMGREVEGDREALLAGREVTAIEGVGILGRGEAGILPDRPGLMDVHGRIGAAQERRQPGEAVERLDPGTVLGAVERPDRDALGRGPWIPRGLARRPRRDRGPPIDGGEIRDGAQTVAPSGSINSSSRRLGKPPEASGLAGAGQETRAASWISPDIAIGRGAHDDAAAFPKVEAASLAGGRDPRRPRSVGQHRRQPTLGLDALKQGPGLSAEHLGQRFDDARTGRRIGDAVEPRFGKEHQRRVAGEPAGQRTGESEGSREGQDRHAIGPAQHRADAGQGGAQEIGMGVAPRHHAPRGLRMEAHRPRGEAAALLDPRPEAAESAELGHRQDVVDIGDEQERDGRRASSSGRPASSRQRR